ncbi:hypothetical protein SeLEV6574_g06951 [Synchytrium endobioticum]|nr:hypothetical protein SeLEV6574_g06951 [Synchytrium endobioticum]
MAHAHPQAVQVDLYADASDYKSSKSRGSETSTPTPIPFGPLPSPCRSPAVSTTFAHRPTPVPDLCGCEDPKLPQCNDGSCNDTKPSSKPSPILLIPSLKPSLPAGAGIDASQPASASSARSTVFSASSAPIGFPTGSPTVTTELRGGKGSTGVPNVPPYLRANGEE